MPGDARRQSAWDYPDCPECESAVFVDRTSSTHDCLCQLCGLSFDA